MNKNDDPKNLVIVGGGLAGSEAAWQAASLGINVKLFEMRPKKSTGAHRTDHLAELVCSNSLGSNLPDRAAGLLKNELRQLGSLLIACADASSLPAGSALAVDRETFSECVQAQIEAHPRIEVIREEVVEIPQPPAIIASGPLTSPVLSKAVEKITGSENLFFYDAIAPIIHVDSIEMNIAYRANRYDKDNIGQGDYINCPFTESQYYHFREELLAAQRIPLKEFEVEIEHGVDAGAGKYFQGCQPIEVIAERGEKALAFGPMRPAGLPDPKTGRWPFAVVQLRQDNIAGDLYNLVGFQTNLKLEEQKRVFRLIPGLENATFERLGQMHRNLFIAGPKLLNEDLSLMSFPGLFIAGQLSGIEGYAGNIASGLIAGINAARLMQEKTPLVLPNTTMIGALLHYITHANVENFQPIKAMFGILPKLDLEKRLSKKLRYARYVKRAEEELEGYLHTLGVNYQEKSDLEMP
jgi:methylenetetrahydrofolate--tRNA-(uracil-5-)-methyltransferase